MNALLTSVGGVWCHGDVRAARPVARSTAAAVLASLLGAWADGYCPMVRAVSGARDKSDSHDCCRKGLSTTPPSCCHSDGDKSVLATVEKARTIGSRVYSVVAWTPLVAPRASSPATTVRKPVPSHGPPPTVLRV
jgi:hypothetical protein